MQTTVQQRRIYNPVQQDAAVFLETAAESGGARTLLEVELAPGGGNIDHRHLSYAERFTCVEGELTVRVDGLLHVLQSGEQAVAEAGVLHAFANDTGDTVRFEVELTPGHRGFEQALQIGYGLAQEGSTNDKGIPRSLVHLALLGELGEMRVSGPLRLLTPILRLIARWGRRRGADAALIERYVRY